MYYAVISPARVDDGLWHHVAGVRRASGYELYVDGSLVATRSEEARNANNTGPLIIGNTSFLEQGFIGFVDEVRIHKRALTPGEVQLQYTAGSTLLDGIPPFGRNGGYLSSPITNLVVSFKQPISAAAFNATNIIVDGQMGLRHALSITEICDRTYEVTFPPLTEDGPYHFTLLPTLQGADGLPLDLNLNGTPGEPEDTVTFILILDTVPPRITQHAPPGDVSGTLSSVDVWFSEAIDKTAFTPADVVVLNPSNGVIPANTITEVGFNRFRIAFPPQTDVGQYHVSVGPNITDLAGNPLNQDGDGTSGEDPDDVYSAVVNLVPVDLALSDVVVSTNQLWVGDAVSVSWSGRNVTGAPLLGDWVDAVYLSTDDQWDINDIRLATVAHTGGLAANEVYTTNATFNVPGLMPGNYRLLIRADVANAARETEEANNLAASGSLPLTMRTFPLAGATFSGVLTPNARSAYFAVNVPIGQALLLNLDGQATTGANSLFVSAGGIPTPLQNGYRAPDRAIDLQLALSNTSTNDQTYYVLVYGDQVDGSMPFDLAGQVGEVFVTGITPKAHGNAENATVTISGAGFDEYTTVEFVATNGLVWSGDSVEYGFSDTLRVALSLTNWPPGVYDVRVVKGTNDNTLADAFEVVQGGAPRLETRLIMPSSLGFNIPIRQTIWIEYTNSGTLPMPAPLFKLYSSHCGQITPDLNLAVAHGGVGHAPLGVGDIAHVLGLGSSATPWILQPGESGRIPIYWIGLGRPASYPFVTMELRTLTADSTELIDWGAQEALIRPVNLDDSSWSNQLARIQAWFGPTWGGYLSRLHEAYREWSETGHHASSDARALHAYSMHLSSRPRLPQEVVQGPMGPQPLGVSPLPRDGIRNSDLFDSPYGRRRFPRPQGSMHYGIDLLYGTGTELSAIVGGPSWTSGGLGTITHKAPSGVQDDIYFVSLNHPSAGFSVRYLHIDHDLTAALYPISHDVAQDEVIAKSGASGTLDTNGARHPHLHLDVGNGPPNPLSVLGHNGRPPSSLDDGTAGPGQAVNESTVQLQLLIRAPTWDLDSVTVELVSVSGDIDVGAVWPPRVLTVDSPRVDALWYEAKDLSGTPYWSCEPTLEGLPPVKEPLATTNAVPTTGTWTFRVTARTVHKLTLERPAISFSHTRVPTQSQAGVQGPGGPGGPGGTPGGTPGGSPGGSNPGPGSGTGNNNGGSLIPGGTPGGAGSTGGATTGDPNDKTGPAGYSLQHYTMAGAPFAYTIRFENKRDVNAPARLITVNDVLDANLDLSTFELAEITLAGQVLQIPKGAREYQARLPFKAGTSDILADVNAALDVPSRTLRLEMKATDPGMGWWLEDPMVGLLYPEDGTTRGPGSISYLVRPKPGLPTGTRIENRARIVFDYNDPIDTPLVFNTIDADNPFSRVHTLPAVSESPFTVEWSGQDNAGGSGVTSYDVYFSADGLNYHLWLSRATNTSALFPGLPGTTYSFYAIARDGAGNVETKSAGAEATTTAVGPSTMLAGEGGCVPLRLLSAEAVTSLTFRLEYPADRLTNIVIVPTASQVASVTVTPVAPGEVAVSVQALTGQSFQGPLQLADVCFGTVPDQPSGYAPIDWADAAGVRPNGTPLAGLILSLDRPLVIGAQPLLEASLSPVGERALVLYGPPSTNYVLEVTDQLGSTPNWQPVWQGSLTNFSQAFSGLAATNTSLFYRARR